jgi:hypothetical protein
VLGAVYPACTFFVVLGTANHFVLDAIGGALALSFGVVVERLLSGRHAYSRTAFASHLSAEPELAPA